MQTGVTVKTLEESLNFIALLATLDHVIGLNFTRTAASLFEKLLCNKLWIHISGLDLFRDRWQ